MEAQTFFDSSLFTWVVLPILIFLARTVDVSVGTIRIILLYRGYKYLSPLLGFIEVLIWLMAVRQIVMNIMNPVCYLAFASGFAMGNYVGMIIEEKLAMGTSIIRVITKNEADSLIKFLKSKQFGVTSIKAQGTEGPVHIIFTIVNRIDIQKAINIIKEFNPKAFYTIEDVRSVSEGVFPSKRSLQGTV